MRKYIEITNNDLANNEHNKIEICDKGTIKMIIRRITKSRGATVSPEYEGTYYCGTNPDAKTIMINVISEGLVREFYVITKKNLECYDDGNLPNRVKGGLFWIKGQSIHSFFEELCKNKSKPAKYKPAKDKPVKVTKDLQITVFRPVTGPDGSVTLQKVPEIGQCEFCKERFYEGDEEIMASHYQDGEAPLFREGDIVRINVPFTIDYYCGRKAVYRGSIQIKKVLPAGDYCNCQHFYVIEALNKAQEKRLIDWLGFTCGGDLIEIIQQATKIPFDEFASKWANNEINVSDLPPDLLEQLLTVQEWVILYWHGNVARRIEEK